MTFSMSFTRYHDASATALIWRNVSSEAVPKRKRATNLTRRDDVERAVVDNADTAMVLRLRPPHRACLPLVADAPASHGQLSR